MGRRFYLAAIAASLLLAGAAIGLAQSDAPAAGKAAKQTRRIKASPEQIASAQRAIQHAEELIRADPKNPLAYSERAFGYDTLGQSDKAIADSTEAVKLAPLAANYINRGLIYEHHRDYDLAIKDFSKAIQLDPKHAGAYECRAHAWQRKHDFQQSLADYNRAIEIDPRYPHIFANRGYVYLLKGDDARALADFQTALQQNPNDYVAFVFRSDLRTKKGDYDAAIDDITKAIEAESVGSGFLLRTRGELWVSKGDLDKALKDFTDAILANENDAVAYDDRGSAWERKNDPDNAIEDYSAAIRLAPDFARAYVHRANAFAKKRQFDNALGDLDKALRLNASDAYAMATRATIWRKKHDLDRAIADASAAIRIDPKYAYAYSIRGNALAKKGDFAAAAKDFSAAIESQSKQNPSANAYDHVAWFYATCPDAKFRDGRKALEFARKAGDARHFQDSADLDALAAAYAETGDFDKAVTTEQEAIVIAGRGSDLSSMKKALALYKSGKPYRSEIQTQPATAPPSERSDAK